LSYRGAQGRNRTTDTVIFSHVLYQLSYLGAGPVGTTDTRRRGYNDKNKGCPVRARGAADAGLPPKRRRLSPANHPDAAVNRAFALTPTSQTRQRYDRSFLR
jgi:hypothetical protein